MEAPQASGAPSDSRSRAAFPLQRPHPRVAGQSPLLRHHERVRTARHVQPNAAVAVDGVARVVGPQQLDPLPAQRLLQVLHARLRVVGQHGQVVGRGGQPARPAQRSGRVGGVKPGGEGRAAAGPDEAAVLGAAAGLVDGREEVVGQVERAAGEVGLLGEGRDGGGR